MSEYLDLEKELEKLSIEKRPEIPTTLAIHSSHHLGFSVPKFTDHKIIASFGINKDKSYRDEVKHAKLNPTNSFPKLVGVSLSTGFESATLINDYQKYRELKQEFFMKWLIKHKYFKGINEKKYQKPDFICFGGRITDSMMSPLLNRYDNNWKIHAVKFQDCIYLWDEKKWIGSKDLQSYYGIYFEHLLTKEKPTDSLPNEYDKTYAIIETKFGTHQILTMNEIDAENEMGELVEIKTYKLCSQKGMKAKTVKYWAQSVVPGIKHLVVGQKSGSGRIEKIISTTVDDIARNQNLDTKACFDFEDRFLTWIKSCFKENDENLVKQFSWVRGTAEVGVSNVPLAKVPKFLLPKWFVKELTEDNAEVAKPT